MLVIIGFFFNAGTIKDTSKSSTPMLNQATKEAIIIFSLKRKVMIGTPSSTLVNKA